MVSRYAFDGDEEYNPQGDWVSVSDYDALAAENQALRERAEAAEAERDAARDESLRELMALEVTEHCRELMAAARRAEAAGWNDAIEAAALKADAETGWSGKPHMSAMQNGPGIGARIARDIRALRRAAPTEGEA